MTKIELIRRTKGLSQVQVAEALGIVPTIVSHAEKKHRRPYPRLRRGLAELYGLPESELFGPDGWPLDIEFEARKLG